MGVSDVSIQVSYDLFREDAELPDKCSGRGIKMLFFVLNTWKLGTFHKCQKNQGQFPHRYRMVI